MDFGTSNGQNKCFCNELMTVSAVLSTVGTAIIYLVRVLPSLRHICNQWLLQAKGQENLGKLPGMVMTERGGNIKMVLLIYFSSGNNSCILESPISFQLSVQGDTLSVLLQTRLVQRRHELSGWE